jgi:hypothetical protein
VGHRKKKFESKEEKDAFYEAKDRVDAALALSNFGAREYKVLLVTRKQTLDFSKYEDWISLEQYAKRTGIIYDEVCRMLSSLEKRQVILRRWVSVMDGKRKIRKHMVGLNPNTEEWIQ